MMRTHAVALFALVYFFTTDSYICGRLFVSLLEIAAQQLYLGCSITPDLDPHFVNPGSAPEIISPAIV